MFRGLAAFKKMPVNHIWLIGLIISAFINKALPDEACKFSYLGFPEDLNDSFVVVPEKVVAMSDFVPVGTPTEIVEQFVEITPSIYFIIDHSSSMWEPPFSPFDPEPSDRWGARFTVSRALIDTIYKLNPESQVGIVIFGTHLFFDPDDNALFKKCPAYDTGAYISLLTLNEDYGGNTGYEIAKYYLETDTVVDFFDNAYVDLIHQPTDPSLQSENNTSTNIYAGFEAAKHGMLASPYPKKDHFIIFFSDGEANQPGDPLTFAYVNGTDVPTTFTIYFTPDDQAFQNLITMTENIQTNGYSISNPITNLWAIEAGHDTLMTLLMENVIGVIISQVITAHPFTITINGLNPVTGWDSTGFTFDKLFPLLGETTNFEFDISYDIYKDSITENGDTVIVKIGDTTHNVNFDAIIEDGAVVSGKVVIECWDRTLEFYYNGSPVALIDENMQDLEIRFTESEIDVLYGYKDVSIIITHSAGNVNDVETFKLEDQGTYFSYTFPREIADPVPDDGTLQHQMADSIIAIFRNPELPLDTLRIAVPFKLSGAVTIQKGIYFDNNAEGFVDSIFIGLTGSKIEENLDELMQLIQLPEHRDFEVLNYRYVLEGIAVDVNEGASAPQTYVTDKDILNVTDTIFLQNGGLLIPTSGPIPIIDSVAPIIMKASLIDSVVIYQDGPVDSLTDLGTDELTVTFSETANDITKERPFKYYSNFAAKEFAAKLTTLSQTNPIGKFSVDELYGVESIQDGDSIWINWALTDNVSDTPGNFQENPDNIRRRIDVEVINVIIKGPYELILKSTILDLDQWIKISGQDIISNQDINDMLKDVEKAIVQDGIKYKGIMIITLEPDVIENVPDDERYEATISICDPVGNIFLNERNMAYIENTKSLIYIWDGRNDNGRLVGSGAYLALISIHYKEKVDEVKRQMLGVKK